MAISEKDEDSIRPYAHYLNSLTDDEIDVEMGQAVRNTSNKSLWIEAMCAEMRKRSQTSELNKMKRKNMIFVFGSNLSGIHGAGAANVALRTRGAKWGAGEGLMGTCYALPTKGLGITPMHVEEVNEFVKRFMHHAYDNPDATYMVTQIGCGLGGFTKEQIAPMFKDAPPNCRFDTAWKDLLPSTAKFWGTF